MWGLCCKIVSFFFVVIPKECLVGPWQSFFWYYTDHRFVISSDNRKHLYSSQIIWYNRCHTKRMISGTPATNRSFGVTTTKIFKDVFLQHTPHIACRRINEAGLYVYTRGPSLYILGAISLFIQCIYITMLQPQFNLLTSSIFTHIINRALDHRNLYIVYCLKSWYIGNLKFVYCILPHEICILVYWLSWNLYIVVRGNCFLKKISPLSRQVISATSDYHYTAITLWTILKVAPQ